MNSITLKDLPPPPEGKAGWPWTEESRRLPDLMLDGKPWPKISIVTPNYNYGQFIEETIRSVLLQGYPNLEYIIMDAGSTDNSLEIIKKYEKFFTFSRSKPDKGQAQSINEGFRHATGDIFAWVNSDDYYYKDVFSYVARKYREIGSQRFWLVMAVDYFTPDADVSCVKAQDPAHNLVDWAAGKVDTNQQGAFWAGRIWKGEGALSESFHYGFDREFFMRLLSRGYKFTVSNEAAARFRLHASCKLRSQGLLAQCENKRIALRYLPGDCPGYAALKKRLLGELAYLHLRLSRAGGRRFYKRPLDLLKFLYYKLQAKRIKGELSSVSP